MACVSRLRLNLSVLVLAKAEKLHIVVSESDDEIRSCRMSVERLAEYLRRHGLRPQAGHLHAAERNASDVLLVAAEQKLHAGLLVIGGYGHSRAREFIFGGFTRHMLHEAPLPVFLSH